MAVNNHWAILLGFQIRHDNSGAPEARKNVAQPGRAGNMALIILSAAGATRTGQSSHTGSEAATSETLTRPRCFSESGQGYYRIAGFDRVPLFQIIPKHHAALHHKLDSFQLGDIGKRIAGNRDEVGESSLL
jgi:hypothetical protein